MVKEIMVNVLLWPDSLVLSFNIALKLCWCFRGPIYKVTVLTLLGYASV